MYPMMSEYCTKAKTKKLAAAEGAKRNKESDNVHDCIHTSK